MFNIQGMVVTLHRARKGNVLVCESVEKEIHPVSLRCHKVCQPIQTETFFSEESRLEHF